MDERQHPGSGPFPDPDDDFDVDTDFDEFTAWLDREVAAGRNPIPPERPTGQGISLSLGEDDGIDPDLLAAVCGTGLGPQFGQATAADVLPPGPVLAALTETAVADVSRLSDGQLIGVLQAARRQENREAWKKSLVIAEFARRRTAEFETAAARGVPVHCRPGQFPGEELAMELLAGPVQTSHAIDDATDLATRLPATLAGMAAGLIDEARAGVIALHTRSLSPDDTTLADEILADLAPALRLDQLIRKAAALEMKLAPEAVKARREHARRTRQRVEVRREDSGNASVAGREMDTADALASKAHIHALALRLRRAGTPGTLDQLRVLVFADLTAGRDPLDRLTRPADQDTASAHTGNPDTSAPPPGGPASATPNPDPADATVDPPDDWAPSGDGRTRDSGGSPNDAPGPASGRNPSGTDSASLDYDHGDGDDQRGSVAYARPPAPLPAMINLVVHAGTLFGWDSAPSEAGDWGLLDVGETRDIVAAASRHPATRWCFTLLSGDGTAAAHGCSSGRHPWTSHDHHDAPAWHPGSPDSAGTADPDSPGPPLPPRPPGPWPPAGRQRAPTPAQAARLDAFLRGLNLTLEPIAKGACDHAAAEHRYTPSRKLAHLVRARTATCDAPGCAAQAVHADLDHTVPFPTGPTDQCNLGPKCRRHHKAKQTPGWNVEQPEPGVIRWTLPSGRTHTTRPTVYGLIQALGRRAMSALTAAT
jgi:hypothetical protein